MERSQRLVATAVLRLSVLRLHSVVAWLPTIAMSAGLSSDQASLIAGLLQLFALPFAFAVPVIAAK